MPAALTWRRWTPACADQLVRLGLWGLRSPGVSARLHLGGSVSWRSNRSVSWSHRLSSSRALWAAQAGSLTVRRAHLDSRAACRPRVGIQDSLRLRAMRTLRWGIHPRRGDKRQERNGHQVPRKTGLMRRTLQLLKPSKSGHSLPIPGPRSRVRCRAVTARRAGAIRVFGPGPRRLLGRETL